MVKAIRAGEGFGPHPAPLRGRVFRVIFESNTPAGKAADVAILAAIVASVTVVMLDSVSTLRAQYGPQFYVAEWVFTLVFTAEYAVRLWCVDRPLRYARSFFGIIDLLAVVPTYLSVLLPGSQYLLTIRALRVLRIFRVLKIAQYVREADFLYSALVRSRRKIAVFLLSVLTLVVVLGSLMYLVEGAESGYTSIPVSVYWAIVTLTTVGYGDISPQTGLGRFLASIIMLTGYGIIAVPTGIVTAELTQAARERREYLRCPGCGARGHDLDARHCKHCGAALGDR